MDDALPVAEGGPSREALRFYVTVAGPRYRPEEVRITELADTGLADLFSLISSGFSVVPT
jgi:hypothetical protein